MLKEIRVNDVGTRFTVTVKDGDGNIIDLSNYSTTIINFIKPDKSVFTRNMNFDSNGVDGKLFYASVSGDLNQQGYWEFYLSLASASGSWSSNKERFFVNGVV